MNNTSILLIIVGVLFLLGLILILVRTRKQEVEQTSSNNSQNNSQNTKATPRFSKFLNVILKEGQENYTDYRGIDNIEVYKQARTLFDDIGRELCGFSLNVWDGSGRPLSNADVYFCLIMFHIENEQVKKDLVSTLFLFYSFYNNDQLNIRLIKIDGIQHVKYIGQQNDKDYVYIFYGEPVLTVEEYQNRIVRFAMMFVDKDIFFEIMSKRATVNGNEITENMKKDLEHGWEELRPRIEPLKQKSYKENLCKQFEGRLNNCVLDRGDFVIENCLKHVDKSITFSVNYNIIKEAGPTGVCIATEYLSYLHSYDMNNISEKCKCTYQETAKTPCIDGHQTVTFSPTGSIEQCAPDDIIKVFSCD